MRLSGKRLGRSFYARPATVVARDLLGRVMVRIDHGVRLSGRLVEAEAYEEDDPASHSHAGRTARNEVMFGRAGLLYVYFTYGMHYCLNVVTRQVGQGSAVLIRALEPLQGSEEMARRRGTADPRLLCSGPARLCQALGVDLAQNGIDLVRSDVMWIEAGAPVGDHDVVAGARVGVRRGAEEPWRFVVGGSPFVSRGRTTSGEAPSRRREPPSCSSAARLPARGSAV